MAGSMRFPKRLVRLIWLDLASVFHLFSLDFGFDRACRRLGRGRGFYDRTFSAGSEEGAGPALFGVCFAFQVVERVPVGEFDREMDAVVTELELIRPRASEGGGPSY